MLENIHELRPASEIISGKFPHTEIELFQTTPTKAKIILK